MDNAATRRLYRLYKWGVYIPFLGGSTAVCGSVSLALTNTVGKRAGSYMGRVWARANAAVTPMGVEVIDRENLDPSRSYVVVANHQSLFDIFVLYGWLDADFRFVMKAELRKVPFLGSSCDKMGQVFIDRSNREAAIRSIEAARPRVSEGTSILFFPEGTRSDSGELGAFKKGAFHFAQKLDLPVLPVSIVGTRDILPNNTMDLYPGQAKLVIGEAIEPDTYRDDMDGLMAASRAAIQRGLDEHRNGEG